MVFAKNFARFYEKKVILGTSDAWSTSCLSHQVSEPAYYIVDCRIYVLHNRSHAIAKQYRFPSFFSFFSSEFCVTAWITLPTSYLKFMQIEICGNLLVGSTDFFFVSFVSSFVIKPKIDTKTGK